MKNYKFFAGLVAFFVVYFYILTPNVFSEVQYSDKTYYVSSNGTGDGLSIHSSASIYQIALLVRPGDTVNLLGGIYDWPEPVVLSVSGTEQHPITWQNYDEQPVVFDGIKRQVNTDDPYSEKCVIQLEHCDWQVLRGFTVRNSPGHGIGDFGYSSDHNVYERIVAEDNYGNGIIVRGDYNTLIDCIARYNYDYAGDPSTKSKPGNNADGISPDGKHNRLVRCISHHNSDDGYDCWFGEHGMFVNCVAFSNGTNEGNRNRDHENYEKDQGFDGNGNGFKLGKGGYDETSYQAFNTTIRCVAYDNLSAGFTTNQGGGNIIINCTAFNNNTPDDTEKDFNASSSEDNLGVKENIFINNLALNTFTKPIKMNEPVIKINNSWNFYNQDTYTLKTLLAHISEDEFMSIQLPDEDYKWEELAQSNFLKLTAGSKSLDKGISPIQALEKIINVDKALPAYNQATDSGVNINKIKEEWDRLSGYSGDGLDLGAFEMNVPRPTVSPTPSVTPKPVSPTPTVTPKPVSPTPTVTPKPVSPTPSVTPKPVSPTPSVTPKPVSPTPTVTPKSVSPTPTVTPKLVSPTPSVTPKSVSPTPTVALQPMPPETAPASPPVLTPQTTITTKPNDVPVSTGSNPTVIDIDSDKRQDAENKIKTNEDGKQQAKGELTGDIVKELEVNHSSVSVKSDNVECTIPAKEFNISKVAAKLDVKETDLSEIMVEVKITKLDKSMIEKYNKAADANGVEIVFPPVSFKVVAKTVKPDGSCEEVTINRFNNYVERVVEIPAGIAPGKITTGIVFSANGSYSPVPTETFERNGKWYARIRSLTNSDYAVIWNPITMKSVENHWSRDAANDMASRLIIFHSENFDPNKAITRADFAEYIVRALGLYREESDIVNKFKDVSSNAERALAIFIANEHGIINGYPDETFRPDQQITREEAMAMYQRAMSITRLTGSDKQRYKNYIDFESVRDWAKPYVKEVLSAHVFNGTSKTTISPGSILTYGEAAQAIKNLLVESKLINQ